MLNQAQKDFIISLSDEMINQKGYCRAPYIFSVFDKITEAIHDEDDEFVYK